MRPSILDAQESLIWHVIGFASVGINLEDSLSLTVFGQPPEGWEPPLVWDGYPVETIYIGGHGG